MTYHESQHYAPYSNDRAWMEREGEPCRHCLAPFLEHHNGRCPKDESDDPAWDDPRPADY